MDSSQEQALIDWINSFDGMSKKVETLEDLSDGVALLECLAKIAPACCDLSLLKRDAKRNWVLCLSNLRKLTNALLEFYKGETAFIQQISSIDTTAIAKRGSKENLNLLIRSVLGAAVQGNNKEECITKIMALDSSSQHHLMLMIQEIMDVRNSQKALNVVQQVNDSEWKEKVQDLEGRNKQLSKDLENAQEELKNTIDLKEQLTKEKEGMIGMMSGLEKRIIELEKKNEELEEERANNEAHTSLRPLSSTPSSAASLLELQEVQAELEDKQATIAKLEKKLEEMSVLVIDNRKLRDENDVLSEKVARQNADLEKYQVLKKKFQIQADLKQLLKEAEQQNEVYMKKTVQLEEKVRSQIPKLQTQLNVCKEQMKTSSSKVADLEMELSSKKNEVARLSNELKESKLQASALAEKAQSQSHSLTQSQPPSLEYPSDDSSLNSLFDRFTPELKEKMTRLELENERLKARTSTESIEEKTIGLELELENAQKLNHEYKQEIQMLKEQSQQVAPESTSEEKGDESGVVAKLQAENTKLQAYLRTARNMITKLREENPKQDKAPPANDKLQEELADCQKRLRESEEATLREQKLLVTSFYEMAMQLQRSHMPSLPSSTLSTLSPAQAQSSSSPSTRPSATSTRSNNTPTSFLRRQRQQR